MIFLKGLEALGWDAARARDFEALKASKQKQLAPARVTGEERGKYRMSQGPGQEFWGEVTGAFRFQALLRRDYPAVGDWVAIDDGRNPRDEALIHHLLPRRSLLSRRGPGGGTDREQIFAANVDTAFVVSSLNHDLNLRRLERYVSVCWNGGVNPVILLSKAELCDDPESALLKVSEVAPGVEVHAISVHAGQGLDELPRLGLRPGQSVVLLGSSGVGKSTLTNFLLGQQLLAVREVRERDDRGRHTTSSRHLYVLPSGAMVIDGPGIRELQLWDDDSGGLSSTFEDVEALFPRCRFSNCRHSKDPGCAVEAALREGRLSPERLQSYLKLQREMAFEARKGDRAEESRQRARWKKLGAEGRERMKLKRSSGWRD